MCRFSPSDPLIIGLGLAKVEARYADDLFSGVVVANTVVVIGPMDGATDRHNQASKESKSSCGDCWIAKS
ncbi:hypothetical protein Tco_0120792 [Tanacetum coccineum]